VLCTRRTFACTGDLPAELSIPVSRLWDGVCDCCDGADEPASSGCSNRCADRAKEQQADALQLFYSIHSSLSKKAAMSAAGAKLMAEWQAQAR
jgi:protein kinase C substrate 80K-H